MRTRAISCWAVSLVVGCGGAIGGPSADGGAGDASGGAGDARAGDLVSGDPLPVGDPLPAGDPNARPALQIGAITVNQAVEIPVVANRVVVVDANRIAPVISLRGALVRVIWEVTDPSYLAAGVTYVAALHLSSAAGGEATLTDTLTIDGDADVTRLDGTFRFLLTAAQVQPDTEYSVTVTEQGEGTVDLFPPVGTPLEPWPEPMVLDVVIVPTCGKVISQDEQDHLSAYLYNTYPINDLRLDFRDSAYPSVCDESTATFDTMSTLRNTESSPPYRHYGALIGADRGGISYFVDETSQSAMRAFSLGDWRDFGPTADLFAHELGHCHGRPHTFEDTSYPYANSGNCGARASYGFGLVDESMPMCHYSNDVAIGYDWVPMHALIPPTNPDQCDDHFDSWSDFMSYNYPYWVSAYTYAALAENIRLTSSWINQGPPGPPGPGERSPRPQFTYYGFFAADGRVLWSRSTGWVNAGDATFTPAVVATPEGLTSADGFWVEVDHDRAIAGSKRRMILVHVEGEGPTAITIPTDPGFATYSVSHVK